MEYKIRGSDISARPYCSTDVVPSRAFLSVECGEVSGCGGTLQELLDRLDDQKARATFFISGRVAETTPPAVREIHRRGHELACLNAYLAGPHYAVATLEFRDIVRRARCCIEDLIGGRVLGFRAEGFTLTAPKLWALDVLADEGFGYDSSIRPGRGGIPGWPQAPAKVRTGSGVLIEAPAELEPGAASRPISDVLLEDVSEEIKLCGNGLDELPSPSVEGLRRRLWDRWFDVRNWS